MCMCILGCILTLYPASFLFVCSYKIDVNSRTQSRTHHKMCVYNTSQIHNVEAVLALSCRETCFWKTSMSFDTISLTLLQPMTWCPSIITVTVHYSDF